MKIWISKQNFEALTRLRQEEGIDTNELVNLVLLDWFKTRGEQKEQPKHKCPMCSCRFFSQENLGLHMERKHGQREIGGGGWKNDPLLCLGDYGFKIG